jgi:hypothetical protein
MVAEPFTGISIYTVPPDRKEFPVEGKMCLR